MSGTGATPLRVACIGALGRMGAAVRATLALTPGATLAGALESPGNPRLGKELVPGVRLTDDPAIALADADAAIDFSTPRSTCEAAAAAAERGIVYVCGTTGLSDADRACLATAAKRIAVVWAPNFSVAVNVLAHLAGRAAELLGSAFDVEIVELHHAAKRDAPSGTALRLGEAVARARGRELRDVLVSARDGEVGARPAGAIGIQALRGGDNPGEHSVLYLGRGERLELVHRAATRDHFAAGAVRAALWARGREPGVYGMGQVLGLEPG